MIRFENNNHTTHQVVTRIAFLFALVLLQPSSWAFAIPTNYIGTGTYTVSVEGARILDDEGVPGPMPFLHGKLFGDFTVTLSDLVPDSTVPDTLNFYYVIDGVFTGVLNKSGVERESVANVHTVGYGRFEDGPDAIIRLNDNSAILQSSIVTLFFGADQYVFHPDVFSMNSPGIYPNGRIVLPATVNTLLPDGSYFFGIPELGQGGDPEVWLEGTVVPTEVPEPASVILLGLGGVALFRRRRT